MVRLRVSGEILSTFPGTLLGIVVMLNGDNSLEHAVIIDSLRGEEQRVRQEFASLPVQEHPHIAPWREAYRKFGAKPKDYPSSVENLIRRVAKGHTISHINTLVDLYNTISLRYVVPLGGEDMDTIHGDVWLTFAGPEEAPVRLLGEKEDRPPRPGEVIYRDDAGAICRRWNWKEAERTKLTKNTRNAFLITEALPPVGRSLVETIVRELASGVQQYCGGNVTTAILDESLREIILR